MSAFQVSDNHINTLVTFAYRKRMIISTSNHGNLDFSKGAHRQIAAQILLDQNIRSVSCRYSEHDQPQSIAFQFFNLDASAVQVLKALKCYEYQACETDDWKDTEAHRIIDWMTSRAIDSLPGYDDAQWEIN